jgi:hypothetical protein
MVHLVSTKRIDLMGKRELQAAQTFKDESPTAITPRFFRLACVFQCLAVQRQPLKLLETLESRVLKTLASAGSNSVPGHHHHSQVKPAKSVGIPSTLSSN